MTPGVGHKKQKLGNLFWSFVWQYLLTSRIYRVREEEDIFSLCDVLGDAISRRDKQDLLNKEYGVESRFSLSLCC